MSQQDEMLDVVDEFDTVTGVTTRKAAHDKGGRHRAVHVLFFDVDGKVVLQKRSCETEFNKDLWTSTVSGHVKQDESYGAAAYREVREELGIEHVPTLQRIGKIFVEATDLGSGRRCRAWTTVFAAHLDEPLEKLLHQGGEVEQFDAFPVPEVLEGISRVSPLRDSSGSPVRFADNFGPIIAFYVGTVGSKSKRPDEQWLRAFHDSLQADRREFDKFAWQIPIALFGTSGVVLGVVFRAAPWCSGSPVLPIAFFALSLLVFGGFLQLQRLHERRRYRGKQLGKHIVEPLKCRYETLAGVNPIPSSKDVTEMVRQPSHCGLLARVFGAHSSTATGQMLLMLLFALLVTCGISRLPGHSLYFIIAYTLGFFLVLAMLYFGIGLHHHRDDPEHDTS